MFSICYTNSNGIPSGVEVAKKIISNRHAVAQEMRELSSQLPQGTEDIVSRNDMFAQVMGDDTNGRVRMYGLGVTKSDLWDDMPSRNTCFRMVMEQSAALARMEQRLQQLEVMQQGRACGTNSPTNNRSTSQSSNHLATTNNTVQSLKVGDKVTIRSMLDSSKILTIGVLSSLDPTIEVGGQPLGSYWCEVHVNVPMEFNEELMMPYHHFKKIGDVIGVSIAWPTTLVTVEE